MSKTIQPVQSSFNLDNFTDHFTLQSACVNNPVLCICAIYIPAVCRGVTITWENHRLSGVPDL